MIGARLCELRGCSMVLESLCGRRFVTQHLANEPLRGVFYTRATTEGSVMPQSKSPEMQGFDDATEYLLDRRPDSVELFNEYHKPPPGIPHCSGCVATTVQTNDCPACQYEVGFADGSSK